MDNNNKKDKKKQKHVSYGSTSINSTAEKNSRNAADRLREIGYQQDYFYQEPSLTSPLLTGILGPSFGRPVNVPTFRQPLRPPRSNQNRSCRLRILFRRQLVCWRIASILVSILLFGIVVYTGYRYYTDKQMFDIVFLCMICFIIMFLLSTAVVCGERDDEEEEGDPTAQTTQDPLLPITEEEVEYYP